jgi:hypothetical protein
MLVIALCSSDSVAVEELAGSSASWSFAVPEDAIGNAVIQAFGMGAGGTLVSSPIVTLNISISAALDSVEAQSSAHYMTVGSHCGEALYGHYHDGIIRSLTRIPGVTIQSSDHAVVTAVAPDSVVAVGVGTATLTLGYQGRTATVPVTVSAMMNVVTGVDQGPPAGPEAARILAVTPNPSRSGVSIRFVLGLRDGITQLDVFDVLGRRVRRVVTDATLGAGMHSATWDGRNDGGGLTSAGLYFATLRAGTARSRTKFILLR